MASHSTTSSLNTLYRNNLMMLRQFQERNADSDVVEAWENNLEQIKDVAATLGVTLSKEINTSGWEPLFRLVTNGSGYCAIAIGDTNSAPEGSFQLETEEDADAILAEIAKYLKGDM